MSAESKDLLTRLLRKEPSKRLGSNMPRDLDIIKKHRFFRKIDWAKLERRELEAPIKPLVTDPSLAENFSTEFTEAAISLVVTRSNWEFRRKGSVAGNRGGENVEELFGGFSFQAGSYMESYFRDF